MNQTMVPRLVLIGHSHLYSIRGGVEALGFEPARYTWLPVWQIEEKRHQEGAAVLLDAIAAEIDKLIRDFIGVGSEGSLAEHIRNAGLLLLLVLGGNEHNVMGMVNTGGDYDFLLPGETGPLRSGSTIVPLGAVRTQMERQTAYFRDMLDRINGLAGDRIACLEPPPPIRDSQTILAKLDPYFRETYGDRISINPPEFRFKLWRLRCMVFQARCARHGIPYIAVPPELMEDGRYLHADAIAGDATHANAKFGATMVQIALNTFSQ
jgi:hypothetical protein